VFCIPKAFQESSKRFSSSSWTSIYLWNAFSIRPSPIWGSWGIQPIWSISQFQQDRHCSRFIDACGDVVHALSLL